MKFKIHWLFRLLPAVVIVLSGCVQHQVVEDRLGMGIATDREFPPLERYKLELSMVDSGFLRAGQDKSVTFILRNVDTIPVAIPEWYSNEADNLVIDCQIWFPNTAIPADDAWVTLPVTLKQPPLRYPLKLGAQMFVSIEVPLDFLNGLRVERGTERRYFLRAKLNLSSVKAQSKYSSIIVRNPADVAADPAK